MSLRMVSADLRTVLLSVLRAEANKYCCRRSWQTSHRGNHVSQRCPCPLEDCLCRQWRVLVSSFPLCELFFRHWRRRPIQSSERQRQCRVKCSRSGNKQRNRDHLLGARWSIKFSIHPQGCLLSLENLCEWCQVWRFKQRGDSHPLLLKLLSMSKYS